MRKLLLGGAVFGALVIGLASAGGPGRTDDRGGGDGESRVAQGFHISPVPLSLEGKNPALVGLGSYLVNAVGSCNDCHTWPNYTATGNPYAGQPEQINTAHYLAGGRPFVLPFGTFISANITPDASGMPAGLTWEEFEQLMRTGHDPDTGDLLQVMPWPVFRNMTDRDLRAIYEFLSAIPHAEPAPGP